MKKNGFVFMETIVVISVLTLTLMLLFTSYSYILRKARARNNFDTTETIYKTYYVKQIIDNYKQKGNTAIGIEIYIQDHLRTNGHECFPISYDGYTAYTCDLSASDYSGYLRQIKDAFEVEKIYYLNPSKILNSSNVDKWLENYDATTIDYLRDLGKNIDYNLLIVKYKKTFGKTDGSYEVIHSSMEVTS